MSHKQPHSQEQHKQAALQERGIRNLLPWVQLHDLGLQLRSGMQGLAVQCLKDEHRHNENHDGHRCQINNKVHKAQPHRRTNHDIWRIPPQGCRAADIGCHDLRHQEWLHIYLQLGSNAESNWHSQQHGGNVIQESRADSRQGSQSQQQLHRLCLDLLSRPNGQKVKQSRLRRNIDDNHHAHQEPQSIEVNMMDSSFLGKDAKHNHEHGTEDTYNGAMHLFRNNQRISDNKDCHRDRCRVKQCNCLL